MDSNGNSDCGDHCVVEEVSMQYTFKLRNHDEADGEIILTLAGRREALRMAREFVQTFEEVEVREAGQRDTSPLIRVVSEGYLERKDSE